MFCRKCGAKIADDAKFCPNCGEPCSIGRDFSKMANEAFQAGEEELGSALHEVHQTFSKNDQMPSGGRERLKDDRGLFIYILLSIITCNIYHYYFIYKLAHDVNIVCDGDNEQTPGLVAFLLLSIVTCGIYSFYWYYKLGNRLSSNASRYGLSFEENGTTILLWELFGVLLCGIGPFIAMYIIIKNTNQLCNSYNRKYGLN